MTPKQTKFVAEYLKDLNATQAAIRAGYSKKTAAAQGHENLRKPEIVSAVSERTAKQLEAADLSAVRVLEEYRRLAFVDTRAFFDAQGNLKPITELTPEQGSALASFEVIKKNAAAGDGVVDTVHKFKVWDKVKVLGDLAKHFGLLSESVVHSGGIDIRWRDTEV